MDKSSYTLGDIARTLDNESSSSQIIDTLLIDSRAYTGNPNALFFALKSEKNDGHKYISQLFERGLRNFVVAMGFDSSVYREGHFFKVENPLASLQKIAFTHRFKFDIPVVGITGSNGKTIVKEWLFQLLHPDHRIIRSPRSYNSQIGVALSLWQMKKKHEMALIECGISMAGEMQKLAKMVSPTIGIFTNIGEAHQENFSNLKEKAEEKAKLFSNADMVICCSDHQFVRTALENCGVRKILTWGKKSSDLHIKQVTRKGDKTALQGVYKGQNVSVDIPFIDDASIENACHCWLMCLDLGISSETISKRMADLSPVAMRLEKRAGIHHSTIINDSYNSDVTSLNIALDFLKLQSRGQDQMLILSDILQTAENPNTLYQSLARRLEKRGITKFIGVGRDLHASRKAFHQIESTFFKDTQSFLDQFDTKELEYKSVLIKGARHFKFEKIVDRFEQKSHETTLEIDLNKMVNNLNFTRSLLHPETKIMAMVKASAYGSGSVEIAATLQYNGVEYLAVAYADEGIALRNAGISLPILVLNPSSTAYDAMVRYDLEPQVYSFQTLQYFLNILKVHSEKTPYPIHIKLNTGMNRLGFDKANLPELIAELKEANHLVSVESIFSHLAASDEEKFDEFSKRQIREFLDCCKEFEQAGIDGFLKHILNSNGIMRHSEGQFDMVRLGLGLYGLSSSDDYRKNLQPIAELKTTLSQVRQVKKGSRIGYSPKSRIEENKTIGIIAIGYADGIPRSLGNGNGGVIINGRTAPFIGHICMDMSMIDVSDIECFEGDKVEIFGQSNSIYNLALASNTIPYEILTNVSQRVKRIFFKE